MVAVLLASALASGALTRPAPAAAAAPAAARSGGVAVVGALFVHGTGSAHTCTGSVVRSGGRAVVLTAAHCLSGSGRGVEFAPGYRDGIAPYGVWTLSAVYVDPGWTASQDLRRDVALAVTAPRSERGRTVTLGDVVTGASLGTAPASGAPVTVVAYAEGLGDLPIRCTHATYRHLGFPAFDCHGFVGGTSGAPWLTGPAGRLVARGVIGGLHQGGCTESTSYSPVFDAGTLALLRRAVAGGPADVLPHRGSDGC